MRSSNSKSLLASITMMLLTVAGMKAQYFQIANQLTNVISPALSGSMNYKGYVEASGLAGFGDNHANFVGISTSQGFQYASWFYMGVGLGIDLVTVNDDVTGKGDWGEHYPDYYDHASSTTRCMIPVFSDFRFNIGPASGTNFFIDLKLGASWLIGSRYLTLQHGRLTGQTQFLLKPGSRCTYSNIFGQCPTSSEYRTCLSVDHFQ